jgi:thiamine-phosphate pyrophosphorylase
VIPRLFYVTDGERGTGGRAQHEVIRAAFEGGVEAVIVREPEPGDLLERLAPLRARGLRVIWSRRLDLVRGWDLDGVHLAADAVPVAEARAWLGPGAWIGYSAHSGEEARRVAAEGASYVTLSPIYATESKPGAGGRGADWLRESLADLGIPVLALGGVTPARTGEILQAGAWGVAAVSAIGAAPDPARAAGEFQSTLSTLLENP